MNGVDHHDQMHMKYDNGDVHRTPYIGHTRVILKIGMHIKQ